MNQGIERRALRVSINAVRRELREAVEERVEHTLKASAAPLDSPVASIHLKNRDAAKDRASEAQLALDYLIDVALFAK